MITYYSPRDKKREYEKMYEATTGKVSNKLLIELDKETEERLRYIAECKEVDVSEVARDILIQATYVMMYADPPAKNGSINGKISF